MKLDVMLAHEYSPDKLKFPCYCQPKLDGVRAISVDGKLYSRTGKRFTTLNHIEKYLPVKCRIDGEIYNQAYRLQEINAMVNPNRKLHHEDVTSLSYWMFDIINENEQVDRLRTLEALGPIPHTLIIPTMSCASLSDVEGWNSFWLEHGYEGSMIRFPLGKYTNGRSNNLLKWKPFKDSEFRCTGINYGERIGKHRDCLGSIQCVTSEGKLFKVGSGFSDQQRVDFIEHPDEIIDHQVTVRYDQLSRDNIPLRPRFIAVRRNH